MIKNKSVLSPNDFNLIIYLPEILFEKKFCCSVYSKMSHFLESNTPEKFICKECKIIFQFVNLS